MRNMLIISSILISFFSVSFADNISDNASLGIQNNTANFSITVSYYGISGSQKGAIESFTVDPNTAKGFPAFPSNLPVAVTAYNINSQHQGSVYNFVNNCKMLQFNTQYQSVLMQLNLDGSGTPTLSCTVQ